MLYYLLYPLREFFFGFNVFKYITFRAAGAAITAFVLSLVFGPYVINKLYQLKMGEKIRNGSDYTALYNLHKTKEGTPTMGGILIVLTILLSTILWADILNKQILIIIFSTIFFGAIGFIDDYVKLTKKKRGLSMRAKFIAQVLLTAGIFVFMLVSPETKDVANKIALPFLKNPVVVSGVLYLIFILCVICGSSNAVNLTDGLDGLAIGCVLITAATYGVLCYIIGHIKFAEYLNALYIPGSGELTVFCASILGAGLGFLWFNSHPASVFMGDIGSITLGGVLGVVAVLIKKEILLFIVGGVFVMEAISVILQIGSFKLRKKRIFAMAPIHHHFEMRGWPETKVTIRFWIIAIICALIGLGSLKMQ
jgi:phospho-N-acetylmuramoyl-pentapeptide-transferase